MKARHDYISDGNRAPNCVILSHYDYDILLKELDSIARAPLENKGVQGDTRVYGMLIVTTNRKSIKIGYCKDIEA
jgi:hypothetical protein